MKKSFFYGLILISTTRLLAQPTNSLSSFDKFNVITTSVPFLSISPDSRSGGMGDVGVSTSADYNSLHWNVAKLAYLDKGTNGLSMSYTPWLSRLVPTLIWPIYPIAIK